MESTQEFDLDLVGGAAPVRAHAVVTVRDWTERNLRNRVCSITLTWAARSVDATSHSVYHAFQDLRARLEPEGLTPNCYGACPDVQASGMQLDMGDGTYAYRMAGVPRGERPLTVNIFETEPGLLLGTVAQQLKYRDRIHGPLPRETVRDRLIRWLRPVGELFLKELGPAQPFRAPIAKPPESRTRHMRPSLQRLIALSSPKDAPTTMDALTHGLLAAMQEIAVLKAMMREKGVWDEALYRRLTTETMIQDHNSAGPFPHESHSYYPYTLDEHEFLRFAFDATDADLAQYDADVESVKYLT